MTGPDGFPSRVLDAEVELFRIHKTVHHAGHFSISGQHRFAAPVGHNPRYGVCYTALDPIGAYVEVFGRIGSAPLSLLSERSLSKATLTDDLRLADLTHRAVLGKFGITGDVSMGADYSASQELSASLHGDGFDGILYRLRHDPQMLLESVALFDTSHPVANGLQWSPPTEIPEDLIQQGYEFHIESYGPAMPLPQ